MARIAFSMAGEGRGHATRVLALVEELRHEHEIALCALGDAWDLRAARYAGTPVEVRRLPGRRFRYDAAQRLDWLRTGGAGTRFRLGRAPRRLLPSARYTGVGELLRAVLR